MTQILGRGVYSFREASRLTGLKHSRVREWFRHKPVFQGDFPSVGGDFAISFYDLVDVFVAGKLREYGVSMQHVRKVYNKLKTDLGGEHPFCRKELLTDGKIVFLKAIGNDGSEQFQEALSRQGVFPQIILPFLKTIDYHAMHLLAARWRIHSGVVVDPEICFGAPVVEEIGIPTSILSAAYEANGHDSELVSRWFNVKPKHILAAVDFEGSLAA